MKIRIYCKKHPETHIRDLPFFFKENGLWEIDTSDMVCESDHETEVVEYVVVLTFADHVSLIAWAHDLDGVWGPHYVSADNEFETVCGLVIEHRCRHDKTDERVGSCCQPTVTIDLPSRWHDLNLRVNN